MYQQPNPGYGLAPDAQPPIYLISQGAGLYPTSTGMPPSQENVGRDDGAYAMSSHPLYHSPPQMNQGMRSSAGNWGRTLPFDSRICYHPQIAEGLSEFGFEDGHYALPSSSRTPDTSYQSSIAGRTPHAGWQEPWKDTDTSQFSSPDNFTAQTAEFQSWPVAGGHSPHSNPGSYPSTSLIVSSSPVTSDIDVEPPRHGEDFIQESFPGDDSEHELLRAALTNVMNADWKRHHIKEPDEDLLLQFQYYDRKEGRWNCRFSKDGKLCARSTSKKDHAKGHIRWHLDHRPFFCENPCPAGDTNCTKQYTAMESLKKHQNGKLECKFCKASMLKGNLQRHISSSCKGLPTPA